MNILQILEMKRVIPSILIIAALACSLTAAGRGNNGMDKQLKDSVTADINSIYELGFFNGFAVSIVDDQKTLYQQGFGFADVSTKRKYTEHTIQNIASISKTFVGIALLKAQELGKLNLDDPIENYLPFKVSNPNFIKEKITIRHLATHTSSIIDNDYYLSKNYLLKADQNINSIKPGFDEQQVFNPYDSILPLKIFLENILSENGKWYKNCFSNNKPGAIYEYSNMGTTLAAFIIEQATGQSFKEFTTAYILKPLKMGASGWRFNDVKFSDFSTLYEDPTTAIPYYEMITYPDGGFITSIDDLSRYLTELIKGYNGKGTILTKKSYQEYFRQQLTASNFIDRNENNPYSESFNVGIFIGFGYSGFIGHTGGDPGVLSMMFFDPKTNLGRIMILNTSFSDKAGNDAFYAIWNILEKYQCRLKL